MTKEKIYPKGIMTFAPHAKAPASVLASIIISPSTLAEWLEENPDCLTHSEKYGTQLKLVVKKNNENKVYCEVDTYKSGSN